MLWAKLEVDDGEEVSRMKWPMRTRSFSGCRSWSTVLQTLRERRSDCVKSVGLCGVEVCRAAVRRVSDVGSRKVDLGGMVGVVGIGLMGCGMLCGQRYAEGEATKLEIFWRSESWVEDRSD